MKWKKEQAVLVVIIAVLGFYLLVQRSGRTHYTLPKPDSLVKKEITKVELKKKDSVITLEKKGGSWIITPQGFPADTGMADRMVDDLSNISFSALAAESGNDAVYGLDADHRIEVRAYGGNDLRRTIEIGNVVPSGRHTFVKLDNAKGIYHAERNLRSVFDTTISRLRNKTVMTVDGPVTSVVLTRGKKKLTILAAAPKTPAEKAEKKEKSSGQDKENTSVRWKTSTGKTADAREVDDLISTLRNLSCDEFIKGREKKNFTTPASTVTLTAAKTHTLSFFKEKGKSYAVLSSDSDYPFHLAEWRVNRIMNEFSMLNGEK